MTANMAVRQSFFTALTDTKTTDVEGVGTLRTLQNGDIYRWVKNKSTTNASRAGAPALFDISANAGATLKNECVVGEDASGDEYVMGGVWMAAVAALSYGWILVRGVHAGIRFTDDVTCTIGDILIPNLATDVSLTAAKCYSFKIGMTRANAVATAYWTGVHFDPSDPHVTVLNASGTTATGTTVASDCVGFVWGLL